ncbi:FISUMP domain-containing protein [Mongoliitalea lutea]|uniref:Fibrobacter succinogenes major paralogous domain-containing protein n=1 Tax=Mongoliitalea lutea TaxID=849756 RepID=A0A8J3D126_9BACT|nr:FISUMP domain-containing protein [Mongoliitalea lutea]GHB53111.1 hypothetical protein GCM10008106_37070 [Mongoliitalea lutea]
MSSSWPDWRSPQNNNLWQGVNGVNNPCPEGYRLPTEQEFASEIETWNTKNSAGAFSSPIKLVSAGYRSYQYGQTLTMGERGYYWTSTIFPKNNTFNGITNLEFFPDRVDPHAASIRGTGKSVRCIKNIGTIESIDCKTRIVNGDFIQGVPVFENSITISYQGGTGGEYGKQSYNSEGVEGLIATLEPGFYNVGNGTFVLNVSGTPLDLGNGYFQIYIGGQKCKVEFTVQCFSHFQQTEIVEVINPITGRVWMDRNLGASQVAASPNDQLAFGDLYQWGRGDDGHQCRNSLTTHILSSRDQPDHSDFILSFDSPYIWRNPHNSNLWLGINGVNNPCPNNFRIPTSNEFLQEINSWTNTGLSSGFDSPLKTPFAGIRSTNDGKISFVDTLGTYWTSTTFQDFPQGIISNTSIISSIRAGDGVSVRCIKHEGKNIEFLDCKSATTQGSLIQSIEAENVTISISYISNGKNNFDRQVINSFSVVGLTATLEAGTFNKGNGTLIYTISGIPNSPGTAYFGIDVDGLSCILEIEVACFSNYFETEIVEITNPITGKTWMDRNLGASRVALDSKDELAYGDLYQWGRNSDGHQCRNSATTTEISQSDQHFDNRFVLVLPPPFSNSNWIFPKNDSFWQGLEGINNPCPLGFRVPSIGDFVEEMRSWDSYNSSFESSIKLPLTGFRSSVNGAILNKGSFGDYWTSDVFVIYSFYAIFNEDISLDGLGQRSDGSAVRCIKEYIPKIQSLNCDSAVNTGVLVQGVSTTDAKITISYSDGNGESYLGQSIKSRNVNGLTAVLDAGSFNKGDGVLVFNITGIPEMMGNAEFFITISGFHCVLTMEVLCFSSFFETEVVDVINPITGKTWMDRNLGASQAATSSTDELAYGDLYQWGRLADGHQCRNSPTTAILSSSHQPIHGDFILTNTNLDPFDWQISQNPNLWQGLDGINNPCPDGYRLPTDTELDEERLSWTGLDGIVGGLNTPLRLPAAGERGRFGWLSSIGIVGRYWSSTVNNNSRSLTLFFMSNGAILSPQARGGGNSVRCIKD